MRSDARAALPRCVRWRGQLDGRNRSFKKLKPSNRDEAGCIEEAGETGDQTRRCVQLGNDVYMPAAPAWASEHRGGPRNFENRIVGTKASWGFPSFLRRQRVFRDGFLSRAGLLTLRYVYTHTLHAVVRVTAFLTPASSSTSR